jgi:hypothetical protein
MPSEKEIRQILKNNTLKLLKGELDRGALSLEVAQNCGLTHLWHDIEQRRKVIKASYDRTERGGLATDIYKRSLVLLLNEYTDIMDNINEIIEFGEGKIKF